MSAINEYAQLIKLQPRTYARNIQSLTPQAGGVYSSKASNQVINFQLPSQGYFDGHASYLSFDLELKARATSALTASENVVIALDSQGSTALFDKCVTTNSSGNVITEYNDFSRIALARIRRKPLTYQGTVGALGMAYSSSVESFRLNDNGVFTFNGADVSSDAGAEAYNDASAKSPCHLSFATADGTTEKSVKVNVIVPMEYICSALCPVNGAPVPLHLAAKRSYALDIKLYLNTIEKAFVALGLNAEVAKVTPNIEYVMSDVALVLETVNLSPEMDDKIRQMSDKNMLEIKFDDYNSVVTTGLEPGVNNFTTSSTKFTMSLKSVLSQIRKNETSLRAPLSATVKAGLESYQVKVGSTYMPSVPIKVNPRGYSGSAFANASMSARGLNSTSGGLFTPSMHLPQTCEFEVGVDFDEKHDSHDAQLTISGKNTTNGASQIETRIVRASAGITYGCDITNVFITDNVLSISNGVATVYERV